MKRFFLVMATVLLIAGSAQAEIVANWDMSGEPGFQTYTAAGGTLDYIEAYNMARGDGLSGRSGADSLNSKGWKGSEAGDYIEFGFSVADGYEITLSELWLGTRSSNTGPGSIGVYISVDAFTTPVEILTQEGEVYENNIIDLSGLDAVSGDFYVRLFEYGDIRADGYGATAGTGTFRITNYDSFGTNTDVQFVGTVAASAAVSPVPVPNAVILLGCGLMGVAGIKRKNI
jgi:hypothetical protein